jgi:tRNA(Ile)-lysidine synthase
MPAKPRPDALHRAARAALAGPCRLPRGSTLLVACSGGPDSLALLHVLAELARPFGLELVVAHLDHGMRGEAGAADARFVRREARRLGLRAVVARADGAAWMRARGHTGEDGLRRLRRAFLVRAAREAGAGAVALGHTADDQAETVLLRLVRGTGLAGLAAMRPRRGRIVRPLLHATRAEVAGYLHDRGLVARRDASNDDPAFRRNYLRAEVLPRLAHLNPRVGPALAALADRAAAVSAWLDDEAKRALAAALEPAVGGRAGGAAAGIRLVARNLLGYHPIVRETVFAHAFRRLAGTGAGLTRRHLAALETLVVDGREGASVDLPGSLRARRLGGRICFEAAAARRPRTGGP